MVDGKGIKINIKKPKEMVWKPQSLCTTLSVLVAELDGGYNNLRERRNEDKTGNDIHYEK